MKLRFYSKEDGTWWLDSPEFIAEGNDPDRLEMVAGADDLLEELSGDKMEVTLEVFDKKKFGTLELLRIHEIPVVPGAGGAYYYDANTEFIVWLCSVTMWIFNGIYPEIIWYKKA